MCITKTLIGCSRQSFGMSGPVRDRDNCPSHQRYADADGDRVRFCEVAHIIGAALDGRAATERQYYGAKNYLDIHEHSL